MAVIGIGAEFRIDAPLPVETSGGPSEPSVAGRADGSFLVAWTGPFIPSPEGEEGPRTYTDIYARAFPPGAPAGAQVLVNTEFRDPQSSPDVAARADGSYFVAYASGVEDQLPGYFLAAQILGPTGALTGSETYSPNYNYYTDAVDADAFSDGGAIAVANDEYSGEGFAFAVDGSIVDTFHFGYAGTPRSNAVTVLDDQRFLAVWSGYERDASDDENWSDLGIWAQVRGRDGTAGTPFEIVGLGGPSTPDVDPVAALLPNGKVVVVYVLDTGGALGREVYATIVDPQAGTSSAPVMVSGGRPGDQLQPDVAVLADGRFVVVFSDHAAGDLGDADGRGIAGRVFNPDGTFDQDLFLANGETPGAQSNPTVAALGGDFVVAWQSPGEIRGAHFDPDALGAPDTWLLTRPGLRDGSPVEDQNLVGPAGANSFFVAAAAASGTDRIAAFGRSDVLVLDAALADPDGDRLVPVAATGLALPGAGDDALVFPAGTEALRSLGSRVAAAGETVFVYADAAGRPQGAIESTLNRDTLWGTAGKDIFFFDTALGAGFGADRIKTFGPGDRIVTTNPLDDPNRDGRVRLDSSDRLHLPTPAADGPSTTKIFNLNDKAVSTLILDDIVAAAGRSYFIYRAAGDAVGGADLLF